MEQDPASSELSNSMKFVLNPDEMKMLEAYSNSLIDYPLVSSELMIYEEIC